MSTPRVSIQWTDTAKRGLAALPLKARRGLIEKADELLTCSDPKQAHKPLVGALQGYYRITYGRFRAIYTVQEETGANGDVVIHVLIRFVAAGIRKEGDKNDIYRFVQRLIHMGLLDPPPR